MGCTKPDLSEYFKDKSIDLLAVGIDSFNCLNKRSKEVIYLVVMFFVFSLLFGYAIKFSGHFASSYFKSPEALLILSFLSSSFIFPVVSSSFVSLLIGAALIFITYDTLMGDFRSSLDSFKKYFGVLKTIYFTIYIVLKFLVVSVFSIFSAAATFLFLVLILLSSVILLTGLLGLIFDGMSVKEALKGIFLAPLYAFAFLNGPDGNLGSILAVLILILLLLYALKLIVGTRFVFFIHYLFIKDKGLFGSLKESWNITRCCWFKLIKYFFLLDIISVLNFIPFFNYFYMVWYYSAITYLFYVLDTAKNYN